MERRFSRIKRIAITGPECSGKTTLARHLKEVWNAGLAEEYAREYLEKKRTYGLEDLDAIVHGQIENERKAELEGKSIIVCDTDMLVIKIWSEVKFGKVSPLVQTYYEQTHYDLTILCKPIYQWEFDPLREAPDENDRLRLYQLYYQALKQKGQLFLCLEPELDQP